MRQVKRGRVRKRGKSAIWSRSELAGAEDRREKRFCMFRVRRNSH